MHTFDPMEQVTSKTTTTHTRTDLWRFCAFFLVGVTKRTWSVRVCLVVIFDVTCSIGSNVCMLRFCLTKTAFLVRGTQERTMCVFSFAICGVVVVVVVLRAVTKNGHNYERCHGFAPPTANRMLSSEKVQGFFFK